ncbi:MAG: fibrobacter succinogenes major paralogous domain-containing protein, partial [Candidatus Symbiothrix sp.]|nr:fibrobacter succinogenes major paralogous domain-containing protein [Candidatus Symbiothrix sp.]
GLKGGLLLSNVALPNVNVIPYNVASAFPGVTSENYNTAEVKSNFSGAMVFHTGENNIPAGAYVWNGRRWMPAGGCKCPAGMISDDECNYYTIGDFGAAGTWMTQNLQSTQYADGTLLPMGASTNVALKYYNYPGPNTLSTAEERGEALITAQLLEDYGLLYSWAAASGRTDDINDSNGGEGGSSLPGYGTTNPPSPADYRQGICPKGWHLPSDYEWYELEDEITANPDKYSDSTLGNGVGTKMKSQNLVNGNPSYGSSFSRTKGGFDALLVGDVHGNDITDGYGSHANFWSSSGYGSSNSIYWGLYNGNTVVNRSNYTKSSLFSVRCKKD